MWVKLGLQLLGLGQSQKLRHFPVIFHLLFQTGNGFVISICNHLKLIVTVNGSRMLQISLSGKLHSI